MVEKIMVGELEFGEILEITLKFAFREAKELIIKHLKEKMNLIIEEDTAIDTIITVRPPVGEKLYMRIAGNGVSIGSDLGCHPIFATKDYAMEIYGFNPSCGSVTPYMIDGIWGDGKKLREDRASALVRSAKENGSTVVCSFDDEDIIKEAQKMGVKIKIF